MEYLKIGWSPPVTRLRKLSNHKGRITVKKTQMKQLEAMFQEMEILLQKILNIQFGIQDKEWVDAMATIEGGYANAVAYIRKHKGSVSPAPDK